MTQTPLEEAHLTLSYVNFSQANMLFAPVFTSVNPTSPDLTITCVHIAQLYNAVLEKKMLKLVHMISKITKLSMRN